MAIAENLQSVRNRIAAACAKSGRREDEVTLVAVTKLVTPAEVRELYRLGVRDFGENRVADGLEQKEALAEADSRWHLIGHLQRNKAADALAGGFTFIHSVESLKLIDVLDKECEKLSCRAQILLEVNVSGEASKYGTAPVELPFLADRAEKAANLDLLGLMTMAPFTDNPEDSRPHFRRLRELRDELSKNLGRHLPHLSMGMTGDFEVAIEEGATLIRVGTALYV